MSAPYKGNVVLNACPAQFGLDLSRGDVGVSKIAPPRVSFVLHSPLSIGFDTC